MISLVSGLSHKNELEGFHGRQFWNPHNILELTEVIPRMVQKVKLLFGSGGVCAASKYLRDIVTVKKTAPLGNRVLHRVADPV